MRFARQLPANPLCTICIPEPKGTAPRRTVALPTHLAALRVLALLSLLVALWACGGGSLNIVTTHRPASELRIELRITDQYHNTPTVDMHVQIFEGPDHNRSSSPTPRASRVTGATLSPASSALLGPVHVNRQEECTRLSIPTNTEPLPP